jgi:sulfonate dioxygenase
LEKYLRQSRLHATHRRRAEGGVGCHPLSSFHQISENPDFQVRFKWEKNSIAFWDNRVVTHSATFDFWPATRHALRATPHGEKPTSVADYEKQTGKVAKDRQLEIWRQQGVEVTPNGANPTKARGYND